MSTLKVLQILPALQRGGVEKGTLEIARALSEKGHDSWVISAGGRLVEQLEREGSKHVSWNLGKKSPSNLFKIRKLRQWLEQESFDIVHVRSRMPAWVTWLAWRKMPANNRPRLVSTVHGLHSVNRYSAIMTYGERVIAVSETGENYILTNYPETKREKIRRIYRGIDAKDYNREFIAADAWLHKWNEQYPELVNKQLITLPGRITRLKGHLDFVDTIRALCNKNDQISGLIVGGVDPKHDFYLLEIQSKINKLKLQDKLILTGDRSDLREIMSISRAVVSLSRKPESFGRTTLESLSLGIPTYGYDHGGVGELLKNLFPEGAVPKGDIPCLVGKLDSLINKHSNDGKRRTTNNENTQSNRSKQIKPHTFTLQNMCDQTLALYQELAASDRNKH